MKKILHDVTVHYLSTEERDRKLTAYSRLMKNENWPVHSEFLLLIRGMIAEEVLSDRFTKLDKEEKDSRQRAFNNVDALIQFLLNPIKNAENIAKIKRHNQEATIGSDQRRKK